MVVCNCGYCGKQIEKVTGHYNRAMKLGLKVYCNRTCAGLNHRTSIEDKKKVKAAYDKKISKTPERKQKKHEYFMKDYAANPEKYKKERQRRYSAHLVYLKTDKYKQWKQEYDKNFRANKLYGEYAEAVLILVELEKLLPSKQIKYDTGITIKKQSQKRKRKWQQLQASKTSMQRI